MPVGHACKSAVEAPEPVDCVVVGAGFGGMHMLALLRDMGLSVVGIEAGGDDGGVWYWNRYPGARCDVMSIDYSYSFHDKIQQEWLWSEQYAAQPEILAHANYVADRLGLRQFYRFNTAWRPQGLTMLEAAGGYPRAVRDRGARSGRL